MGVFFYTNSVALVEDIPLEEEYPSEHSLATAMDAGFQQVCHFEKILNKVSARVVQPVL